jgi:hypothetical protein
VLLLIPNVEVSDTFINIELCHTLTNIGLVARGQGKLFVGGQEKLER